MFIDHKHIGETPLQFLGRMRKERPELAHEKLTYAGRLDPMAQGTMLVLVGDEVHDKEKYLGYEKEYRVTFLVGVATDSGDRLGKMTHVDTKAVAEEKLQAVFEKILRLKKQTYPWLSGKTVAGKKLFTHFKEGNRAIERPTRAITVRTAQFVESTSRAAHELQDEVLASLGLVQGDFRQQEIAEGWQDYFKKHRHPHQMVTGIFRVSSGTFIRGFTELFPFPVMVWSLTRTRLYADATDRSL